LSDRVRFAFLFKESQKIANDEDYVVSTAARRDPDG
jgi:hypothetical protein